MSDGLPDAPGLWTALAGAIGAAFGGVSLWLANRLMGKAAFQQAINSGFSELTKQLREERDFFRNQLAEERIAWAAERAEANGKILNLTQSIESLKHLLIRHGIPVPLAHQEPEPFTVIEGSDHGD
ncbi:hypothetical protein [Phenylobacterium koreense]|uniref:Minor tail protein n=1 Tax=Phenylobacterium koreense TaxID=266125 RepID=A0ABV2EJX4_9CAUL